METVIFLLMIGAAALIHDRLGGQRRAVEQSIAYRQALTGMIREPRTHAHVAIATGPAERSRPLAGVATETTASPAELSVQGI